MRVIVRPREGERGQDSNSFLDVRDGARAAGLVAKDNLADGLCSLGGGDVGVVGGRLVELPEEAAGVLGLGLRGDPCELAGGEGELVAGIVVGGGVGRDTNLVADVGGDRVLLVPGEVVVNLLRESADAVLRALVELGVVAGEEKRKADKEG